MNSLDLNEMKHAFNLGCNAHGRLKLESWLFHLSPRRLRKPTSVLHVWMPWLASLHASAQRPTQGFSSPPPTIPCQVENAGLTSTSPLHMVMGEQPLALPVWVVGAVRKWLPMERLLLPPALQIFLFFFFPGTGRHIF